MWKKANKGGGNVSWYSHYEKQYEKKIVWRFLRKLKTELSYGPTTPLLGIYIDKL